MPKRQAVVVLASAVAILPFASASRAAIDYYGDAGSFRKTHERLTTEDFEAGRPSAGEYVPLWGSLVPGTASAAFSDKGLHRGFSIAAVGRAETHQLVVVGPGTTPGATRGVGVAQRGDGMEITFDATSAVGMNLIGSSGPGKVGGGKFKVTVYGDNGEIGTQFVDVKGSSTFWGVSTGVEKIRRISITNVEGSDSVFVDNLTFAAGGDTRSKTDEEIRQELIAALWDGNIGSPLGDWSTDGSGGGGVVSADSNSMGGGGLGGAGTGYGGGPGGGSGPSSASSPGASSGLAYNPNMPPASIPEPAVPAMIALGVAALGASSRGRRAG